jgi:hypothetical protein
MFTLPRCTAEMPVPVHSTYMAEPLKGATTSAGLTAGECVNQLGAGKTARFKPTAQELRAYLKEVALD